MEWLGNSSLTKDKDFVESLSGDLGWGLVKESDGFQKIEQLSKVKVVLKKTDKSQNGFVVFTAYLER